MLPRYRRFRVVVASLAMYQKLVQTHRAEA